MPESVSQIDASRDPSVTKQYDSQSSTETKLQDFYALTDARNVSLLTTYRQDVGPVARSMAVAKRTGPDFLYLANANSTKFQDLAQNTVVNLSFQDSKTEDWVSVTGKAVTTRSDDPRIKEIWSKGVSAWFGDIGDGVHDGGPQDPRMKLIEVQSTYITYWKRTTGALGFAKEIGGAILTGGVANTGDLREIKEDEIRAARAKDSAFTK